MSLKFFSSAFEVAAALHLDKKPCNKLLYQWVSIRNLRVLNCNRLRLSHETTHHRHLTTNKWSLRERWELCKCLLFSASHDKTSPYLIKHKSIWICARGEHHKTTIVAWRHRLVLKPFSSNKRAWTQIQTERSEASERSNTTFGGYPSKQLARRFFSCSQANGKNCRDGVDFGAEIGLNVEIKFDGFLDSFKNPLKFTFLKLYCFKSFRKFLSMFELIW